MAKNRQIRTFSLTNRAAGIADGWQKDRLASKIISKMIENAADGFLHAEKPLARMGDLRKLNGLWHELTEDGYKEWIR